MATKKLNGKRILIIATDGFEDTELLYPRIALAANGANVDITGKPMDRTLGNAIKGKVGYIVDLTRKMKDIDVADYDALVIPGGHSPDRLRTMDEAIRIAKDFADTGKLIAAICHGPQLLIEADAVSGRVMTSWKAVKTDLINAGAEWVDEDCVIDRNFITARFPQDLYAWSEAIIEALK